MPESQVPSHQEIHGVSTQNHSQAFVGTARDVYFAASQKPQEAVERAIVACRNALFLTDPHVDRESVISAKGTRAAGTCEWITRNAEYCAWLNGSDDDNTCLLWISGGPGKGKTMLSIYLTEELEKHARRTNNTDLVFMFCSADNDKRNTSVAVLRGLVHQILTKRPHLAKDVLSYFEPAERAQQTVASLETLWLMFSKLVGEQELGTIFCVLDGLDECEENTLKVLLPRIINLFSGDNLSSRKGTFKLVIVSRDIPGLQHCARVKLDPDNDKHIASDIELFVCSRVAELSRIDGFNDEFRRSTQKALLERAEGTFLWVGFAMHELSQKQTCTEIWEALTNLPSGLPAIYRRMLLQIPAKQREISQRVLRWVTTAVRPLRLRELAAAVGIQAASPQITIEQATRDTVTLCGPLLKIQNKQIRLVHQSARDYLLRKHHDKRDIIEVFRFEAESAHLELAQECLNCIAKSELQHHRIHLSAKLGNGESPLLRYAILYWPEHAKRCSMLATHLFDPFGFFLQKRSCLRLHWWVSYVSMDERWTLSYPIPPLLHMACFLQIMPWAEALLAKKRWRPAYYRPVNEKNLAGETALHWAVRMKSEVVARLLIDSGADINIKNERGETALHLACKLGDEKTVRLLLDKGADFNAKTNAGATALYHTVRNGSEAVVHLLIDRGLDVNAKQQQGETALHWAVRAGKKPIVQLLMDKGADLEAKDFNGKTALHWAAEHGEVAVARLLVSRGADPRAEDNRGRRGTWMLYLTSLSTLE